MDPQFSTVEKANEMALSKNAAPFFSIIIPAYNAAHLIVDALNSVLAQTIKDYEIILVNDGSPDTPQLEKALEPYLNYITYITRPNGGPAAARNSGINVARGKYIAFLDSDDQWVPNHLAEMKAVFERDPTIDLVYGDAVNFGENAVEGGTTMSANPSEGLATFESLVLCKCTVIGSTVVARRQALIDAGLFDESFMQGEDFDLWARVAYYGGRIDYRKHIHARRRIHKGNLTVDTIGSFLGQAKALRKLINELDLPESLRQDMQKEIEKCDAAAALYKCKQQLVAKRYQEAVAELRRANAAYRSRKLQVVLYLMRTMPRLVRHLYLRQQNNGTPGTNSVRVLMKFIAGS
ncbi:MAG TPA: glycosyltransferase family A protein [Pyrinomonadaceae bacterium]|nr:glycosyltransferase family A protein [Pyrinomonadaceae bacterium]